MTDREPRVHRQIVECFGELNDVVVSKRTAKILKINWDNFRELKTQPKKEYRRA